VSRRKEGMVLSFLRWLKIKKGLTLYNKENLLRTKQDSPRRLTEFSNVTVTVHSTDSYNVTYAACSYKKSPKLAVGLTSDLKKKCMVLGELSSSG